MNSEPRLFHRRYLTILAVIALLCATGLQHTSAPDARAAGVLVTRTYSSSGAPVVLSTGSIRTLSFIEVPDNLPIAAIRVKIRLLHNGGLQYVSLTLASPSGQSLQLINTGDAHVPPTLGGGLGSGPDCASGTMATFTSAPPASQTLAISPPPGDGQYTGVYLPAQSFAGLTGSTAGGAWFLRGFENDPLNGGALICWQIEIDSYAATGSPSPAVSAFGSPINIFGVNMDTVTRVSFSCSNLVEVGECAGFFAGFTKLGPTHIRVTVPAGVITGPITLHFPGGTSQTPVFTPTGFRPLPSISSITGHRPGQGRVSEPLTITGNSFGGATSVTICGEEVAFSIDTNNKITAFAFAPGTNCAITIVNPTGAYTRNNAVTILDAP